LRITFGVSHASLERLDGRVDLPLLADRRDPHGNFPDVGFSFEMLAPITLDGHTPDQTPRRQLPDRDGNIRSREPEHRGDLFGRTRPFREIKQCMDLTDRAIDAPLPAHVTPMQHEALDRVWKLFCIFYNFYHDRNIAN